ncbi:MAG: TetR/AcrR family transcriptional regulator [Hamadaea sp.]|nr:TetR/AcrR family transcriptional regulator [Hamadaea sp.]
MELPAPPWQRPAKVKPVRRQLSQESVVDAALRVLDKEGLDAVTMRRVAQELETGAASLYVHVANKDELHRLILDRVSGEIPLPEPDPERWEEQIKQLLRDSVQVFASHPGVAQIAMADIPSGPNALRMMECMLSLLRMGGLPDQVAAWAGDLLGLFVPASALEATLFQNNDRSTPGEIAEWTAQFRGYLAALPADRFPTLVALAGPMTTGDGHERFEFKLDVLLSGLVAVARRTS